MNKKSCKNCKFYLEYYKIQSNTGYCSKNYIDIEKSTQNILYCDEFTLLLKEVYPFLKTSEKKKIKLFAHLINGNFYLVDHLCEEEIRIPSEDKEIEI